MTNLNVVLYSPEIPQNTGNIGRTCYLTQCSLHLIEPLGFSVSERGLRRAGLDYWKKLDVRVHRSLEELLAFADTDRIFLATTKGARRYTEAAFRRGDWIIFGRESGGLPRDLLERYRTSALRIPMHPETDRSLNLSNAAAVIIYEALRQLDFCSLR
ncbi:MAG: tRNA (cytidine(34)-2'-O)-methyltransferase [Abditibacteriota bacterium]|nr:tRNA (cytidine(34)-2'-O)-methyltransferase [Abditibacteriota bacterium]